MDRIARAARTNKQLIYAYFGSKDELFDAALTGSCTAMAAEVPFEAEDIPGYVGRLFDYAVANPEIFRLVPGSGFDSEDPWSPERVARFREAAVEAARRAVRTTAP